MLVLLAAVPDASADGSTAADPGYEAAARAYRMAGNGRLDDAIRLMRRALDATRAPALRRQRLLDLAHWLERAGRDGQAARIYERAARLFPEARLWKAAGYARLRAGDDQRAAALAAFEHAADLSTDDPALWRQIGWLRKALGWRRAALAAFRRAWNLQPIGPPAPGAGGRNGAPAPHLLLAREIALLEDRWQGSLDLVWRANAPRAAPVVLSERSLTSSQVSILVARRLGALLGMRRMRAFARLLAAPRPGGILPRRDGMQAGVGLSWRPMERRDLVLTLERLIGIGRFARDDFMLRAAWSTGAGHGLPQDDDRARPFWSIYLDGALIDPTSPDLLGNAQGRIGQAWRFGRLVMAPLIAVNLFAQRDDFGTVSLLQVEPGVELRWSIRRIDAPRPPRTLVLHASFQKKVAGSSRNNRGLALRLSWRF